MRAFIILIIFLLPYDSFSQDTSLTLNNLKFDWGGWDKEGGGILLFPMILTSGAILGAITGGIVSMSNGRYLDYKLSGTSDFKRKELKRLMEKWGKR